MRSALPLFLRSVGAQAQAESKGFSRLKELCIMNYFALFFWRFNFFS